MTVETRRTFCRFCHANCAMLATVEDGVVTSVRGDPDDPMSGGYTCIKGRQLAEAHTHPTRLRACLERQADGGFAEVSTEAALDGIAAKLRAIIDQHGRGAVAVYAGTYAFQNSAGVAVSSGLTRGLGSHHFYTSVTLDQPAKVYTTARMGGWSAGLHPFTTADVALMVGNNPQVSHYAPPGGVPPFSPSRRMRDAKGRGLKLIVIDPRESDAAKLADIHLQVTPGEDATLLAAMLNVILSEGLEDKAFCQRHAANVDELTRAVAGLTPEVAAARCGVPAADIVGAARMFAAGPRGAATTGTGPEMSGHGTLVNAMVVALNIVCGRFVREGEPAPVPRVFTAATPRRAEVTPPMQLWGEGQPKSRFRGLTMLGGFEMPCNVLADEILTPGEGQVRALICVGGNPVVAFPDQDKIVRAMDDLDLLVTIDIRVSQTARRADYVLAPAMCLEREDITNLSEWWYETPYARYTRALTKPPGDLIDEWEMLWGLAKRLGTPIPVAGGPLPVDVKPSKAEVLDLASAGCLIAPSRVRADTPDGAPKIYDEVAGLVEPGDPASEARFDLTPGTVAEELIALAEAARPDPTFSHRLVSRRTRQFFNSSGQQYNALRAKGTTNYAHVHPADLSALGLADGDTIRIEGKYGSLHGVVKASAEVKPGVVSMAHAFGDIDTGLAGLREHGASTNRLAADDRDYDPITGHSKQSAIPVNLVAVA